MSSKSFTKENLDNYLKELAKEYKKLVGKSIPAEIVLVGGASVLTNYGFRDMTTDVDAIIHAASSMKDAINHVGDKYNLPNGWLNMDFMKTSSYSRKLDEVSVYYKTFYGVLTVRTIADEYLIAMKLRSGRKYKNDLSDIIGILAYNEKNGHPINIQQVNKAVEELYGGWNDFPNDSKLFIESAIKEGNYGEIYASVKNNESVSKELLIDFEGKYSNVVNVSNVDEILETLKRKLKNPK